MLIDKEKVISELEEFGETLGIGGAYIRRAVDLVVRPMPEADEAKDLRQKLDEHVTECEHCLAYDPFDNGVDGFCRKMGKVMHVSDFCSSAERNGDD